MLSKTDLPNNWDDVLSITCYVLIKIFIKSVWKLTPYKFFQSNKA